MVIAYENIGRAYPSSVGAFVADKDIDSFLRMSEPATHDRWDPTSTRLSHAGEDARDYVKSVIDRIKYTFRKFQSDSIPPQPPGEKRLKLLERDLGALFKPPYKGSPPPVAESVPISIQFIKHPEIVYVDENVMTQAGFSISLREDAEMDKADANLMARIAVLEDDNAIEGEILPITLESVDSDEAVCFEGEASFSITLHKGVSHKFRLKSDPYDPNWSTRITIQVAEQKEV